MGERKRFNLSLSMDNPLHREAWEVISGFPDRERTNAVCWGVCRAYGRKNEREEIREMLREELKKVCILPSGAKNSNTDVESKGTEVEDVVMDGGISGFLSGLWEGKIEGL